MVRRFLVVLWALLTVAALAQGSGGEMGNVDEKIHRFETMLDACRAASTQAEYEQKREKLLRPLADIVAQKVDRPAVDALLQRMAKIFDEARALDEATYKTRRNELANRLLAEVEQCYQENAGGDHP